MLSKNTPNPQVTCAKSNPTHSVQIQELLRLLNQGAAFLPDSPFLLLNCDKMNEQWLEWLSPINVWYMWKMFYLIGSKTLRMKVESWLHFCVGTVCTKWLNQIPVATLHEPDLSVRNIVIQCKHNCSMLCQVAKTLGPRCSMHKLAEVQFGTLSCQNYGGVWTP